ncbi:MAG: glutamyl-tRNA synthetase [Methylibium sp. NZG]|nr:MAG: glutamyl-tRNA synthetase [Methylibium sp. NZG]
MHAGSLVAALASWLDARAHGGRWLVRIEDVDTPRCVPGADRQIVAQLAACGLVSDEPVVQQSARGALYEVALTDLLARHWAYPCGCSRSDIDAALAAQGVARPRHGERVYPGTCRAGLHGKPARAVRLLAVAVAGAATAAASAPSVASDATDLVIDWADRRLGPQRDNVSTQAGDFVLRRADGLWAYQLAVVVDDAEQAVTHVVRGEDLADNTARQIHLQRLLGLPTPTYLHTPLVRGRNGEKLSKQNGAQALELGDPAAALRALRQAAAVLDLHAADAPTVPDLLAALLPQWRARWLA